LTFDLRTVGDPLAIASAVRTQTWAIDRDQPIAEVSTMAAAVDQYVAAPRFRTLSLVGLAVLGLALAMIGIHGVTAQAVTQRTPEIAVRVALGAERRQVVRLMLAEGCRLAVAGSVVGVVASIAVSGLLRAFLFESAAIDPVALIGAAVPVLGTAIAACYPPARRAVTTDTIRGLHGEAVRDRP
jgi:putative ABC transport system permease protein